MHLNLSAVVSSSFVSYFSLHSYVIAENLFFSTCPYFKLPISSILQNSKKHLLKNIFFSRSSVLKEKKRNSCTYTSRLTCYSNNPLTSKFLSTFFNLSSIIYTKKNYTSLFIFTPKRTFFLDSAQIISPHPCKKAKGGDDAAFCNWRYIGIADGVGGWECSGIDAGKYSKELILRVQEALIEYDFIHSSSKNLSASPTSYSSSTHRCPSPVSILKQAYAKTKALGSTTCCLIFLDVFGKRIHAANLGDSGFILFRPSENAILCRSEFQCHDFNFPLQLGTGSSDMPEHCDVLEFSVKKDDWIIAATDGLWDNVYEHQVIDVIRQSQNSQEAVKMLSESAIKFSQDPTWHSPFSEKERMYLNSLSSKSIGGKPDDISIVVAQVKDPWTCERVNVPNEVADYIDLDKRREEKKKLQLTKIIQAKNQRKCSRNLWKKI